MRHLNYSHLQYFWVVAQEGSIVKAAERLHLTPQTISGQLKLLDEAVGESLFERVGRGLTLSSTGKVVLEYANDIFRIGSELADLVHNHKLSGPAVLTVGIVNSLPKLIAERLLAPALQGDDPVRLRCHEAPLEQLLADLAVHRLDIVLTDQPMPQGLSLKAFSHHLGQSGISFFCSKPDARALGERFPQSLNDTPMLLPGTVHAGRRKLDEWFEGHDISPNVVGEFDDSALLKAFGEAGLGVFPAPTVIQQEICRMYNATVIGRTADITEDFYAISSERRITHPAVARITESARSDLFSLQTDSAA